MSVSKQPSSQLSEIDLVTLGIYVALVSVGWLMIYAVTYDPKAPYSFLDFSHTAGKQLFFIALCLALIFVIMMTEWTFWRTFAFFIYIGSLVILPGTLIFGREINGAHAWFQFGGFSFQPSEIAKFGTCLAMASYMSSTGVTLKTWPNRFIALGIFMLPVIIVMLQQDTGTALIFFSFMLPLYREGFPRIWYVLGFGTAAVVILGLMYEPPFVVAWLIAIMNFNLVNRFRERTRIWWGVYFALLPLIIWWTPIFSWFLEKSHISPESVPYATVLVLVPQIALLIAAFLPNYLHKNSLIQRGLQINLLLLVISAVLAFSANFACYKVLAPHQRQRVLIWLKPNEAADPRGKAYNILHSIMTIGSGGFSGKGFLEGNMTKLKFVPKQSTDFIFCTVGEEQGFIGVVAIIALFTLLFYRISVVAERQRSNFSRVYAYCVAGIIFVHFILNVGMTMGLFPVIGVPLPFISYGGSSLIGFTLMIAVLLKLDSHRNQA